MPPVMPLKDSRARAAKALELRGARWTWPAIADELGFHTAAGARLAVTRLIKSGMPDTPTKRAVATAKLEDQERRLYPRFEAAVEAGDDEQAVRISKELRGLVTTAAQIEGIAAPQRAQVEVNVTMTTTQIIAEAKRRLLALDNTIDAEVVDE